MLEALMRVEGGPDIMPFVRRLCGQPSTYLVSDDGTVQPRLTGRRKRARGPVDAPFVCSGTNMQVCARLTMCWPKESG